MSIGNGSIMLVASALERPLFSLDSQTVISICVQLLNLAILAVLLRFILYKPVRKFLKARTEKIEGQICSAEETRINAEQLIEEYKQKLIDFELERSVLLEDTRSKATVMSDKILIDANKEITAMKALADEEIQRNRERADAELKQYVISIATNMAEKIVALSIDDETLDRLFLESLSEMENAL